MGDTTPFPLRESCLLAAVHSPDGVGSDYSLVGDGSLSNADQITGSPFVLVAGSEPELGFLSRG